MATEDWDGSEYIQAAGSSTAAQMRKEFSLPAGAISRARAFFAMPGYGKLLVNGNPVDGIAGTRTWSQYDKRTIYGCYDIKDDLVNGANAVGVSAGKGWYGHFGYGESLSLAGGVCVLPGQHTSNILDFGLNAMYRVGLWDRNFSQILFILLPSCCVCLRMHVWIGA